MQALTVINEFKKRSRPLSAKELEIEARFSPTKLDVRKISKSDYQFLLKKFLSDLDEHTQARLWLEVYKHGPYRNLDSIVIDFFKLRSKKKTFDLMIYGDEIYAMVAKIDCWMTGDMLANMTSLLHEQNPKKYAPAIERWSKSSSPWAQRMALLSLFYYSRCRTQYPSFEQTVRLLNRHLKSDHYYVQKALGWTLRELHNVYPVLTKAWLNQYLLDLSPPAFTTSTEKIKGKTKDQWKQRRALARKNGSVA